MLSLNDFAAQGVMTTLRVAHLSDQNCGSRENGAIVYSDGKM
jgi:hypothetical protein